MGVFDKAKFWKKDDFVPESKPLDQQYDFSTPHTDAFQDPAQNTQTDGFAQFNQQAYPQTTPFPGSVRSAAPQVEQYVEPVVTHRDIELILAKLDAIKSDLDSLHQRVRKIEQATEQPQQQKRYW